MSQENKNLKKHLDHFHGRKILVVGDLMVDRYIWGTVDRISPEAPVPIVNVSSESSLFGGATNVLHNIMTLGGKGFLCGVVGNDEAGRWIQNGLKSKGVEEAGIVVEEERPTTQKTRIMAHQQQVVRYDHEKRGPISMQSEARCLDFVIACLKEVDCLVISDYAKGVITTGFLKKILPVARRRGVPILIDSKVKHFGLYKGVMLVTPNHKEAAAASGIDFDNGDPDAVQKVGLVLLKKIGCQAVLITRGEYGMSLIQRAGGVTHIPTVAREVYDVTGAGDTVIGTLALAVAAGVPLCDAANLANHAAAVVVGRVGTATVSLEELKKTLS